MKKVILTDADGVLNKWHTGIKKFNESKGIVSSIDLENIDNAFLSSSELFPSDSDEKSFNLLKEYNKSKFCRDLDILEKGSDKIIQDLSSDFDIIVLSSFGECALSQYNREYSLKNIYGDIFKDIMSIPLKACKEDYLTKLNNDHDVAIWLDDIVTNVQKGFNAGIEDSFQYTHNINCGRNTGEVPELKSWTEIKSFLETNHL
jgi:hypothetical protein